MKHQSPNMTVNQYIELRDSVPLRSISFGRTTISLFKEKELRKAQIGYSVDSKGKSLCGSKEGDWRESWLVIADEDVCGDPIFIDLANDDLPVYTAINGEGDWEPKLIANSFQGFIQVLEQIKSASKGRENPAKLEKHPLSKEEFNSVLKLIKQSNPTASFHFWEQLLTE